MGGSRQSMEPRFECHSKKWDLKCWPKLDVDKPTTFGPWFTRARRWIIDGDPRIERLMTHLEKTTVPILTDVQELAVFRAAYLPGHWHPSQVSREISDAITLTGEASVAAASAMIGESLGFELYRHIYQKFRSVGPDQGQRILDAYLHPKPCRNYVELQSSLLAMAQTERELMTYGELFTPNVPQQTMALERRLPMDLLRHLEDQMIPPLEYLRKKEFVQHRVDMDVARHLRTGGPLSALAGGGRPGRAEGASPSLGDFFNREDDETPQQHLPQQPRPGARPGAGHPTQGWQRQRWREGAARGRTGWRRRWKRRRRAGRWQSRGAWRARRKRRYPSPSGAEGTHEEVL